MQKQHKFSESDKLTDIIHEDHSMLWVISRFGLSLGFGDSTVKQISDTHSIDCHTFLAVVNFLSEENFDVDNVNEEISILSLITYLKNAHNYFLDFKLPAIKTKLIQAIDDQEQNMPYSQLFIKFFDEYVFEVQKHMDYENRIVFKYVLNLIEGKRDAAYRISIFQDRHNEIDSKLSELKNILIKYYPAKGNNHLLTEVLFDILLCEKDLASHNQVEDYLFVPAVEAFERQLDIQR